MEKLKSKSIIYILLITLIIFLSLFSEPLVAKYRITKSFDTSDLILIKNSDNESFVLKLGQQTLLEGTIWPRNSLGALVVPVIVNDTLAERLFFNGHNIMTGRRQLKRIDNTYVEHGLSYQFSDKGVLMEIQTYYNGKPNGLYTSYYENGRIRERGYYTNNSESGTWEYYNEKGNLLRKVLKKPIK